MVFGERHVCQKSDASKNLLDVVMKAPKLARQQLVASLLRDLTCGVNPTPTGQFELSLPTRGRPLSVTVGSIKNPPEPPRQMSGQALLDMQVDLDLSNRALTRGVAPAIRQNIRRRAIEPNLPEFVAERSNMLNDFYTGTREPFVVKTDGHGNPVEWSDRPFVYAKVPEVIEFVNRVRNNNPATTLAKVMADGGGNSFKVCLSLIPADIERPTRPTSEVIEDESDDSADEGRPTVEPRPPGRVESLERKRPARAKKAQPKDTGVNKLIIIAIVPQILEHRDNLERVFTAIELDKSDAVFVADMKIYAPTLGLSGFTSKHPCLWCDVTKEALETVGTPRSFGDIRMWNTKFVDAGGNKANAQFFCNCVNRPLFEFVDDDMLVLLKCLLPEFHLMEGNFNTMYKGLIEVWGLTNTQRWPTALGVMREEYHDGNFAGNPCKILLSEKSLQKLTDLAGNDSRVLAFIEAFRALNAMVDECFGLYYNPDVDHKALANTYREKYLALNISVTPKAHAVMFHVVEFMDIVEDSLGIYAEQACETLHSKWEKTWRWFGVRNPDHWDYCRKLGRAMADFSGKRL